jgi:hypothetical protein
LIDISNKDSYTVVTNFLPNNYVPPPTPQPSKSEKTITIIIGSVFGTLGLLIIIGGAFLLIKRRRIRGIPTPSEAEGMVEPLPSTPGTSSSIYERNNANSLSSAPSSPSFIVYNSVNNNSLSPTTTSSPTGSAYKRNNINTINTGFLSNISNDPSNNFYERNSVNSLPFTSGAPNNDYERNRSSYPNAPYERNINYSDTPNIYERNNDFSNNIYERNNNVNYSGIPIPPSRNSQRNSNNHNYSPYVLNDPKINYDYNKPENY